MAKRRVPDWLLATAYVFFALWGTVTAFYWLGASGINAFGRGTSFARSGDFALLKIDQERAFRVGRFSVDVTRYQHGTFPFCPLCGIYESSGAILSFVDYRKGDWFYAQITQSTPPPASTPQPSPPCSRPSLRSTRAASSSTERSCSSSRCSS